MDEDSVKKSESDLPEETTPRRDLLRMGLAAVAGATAGYSILSQEVQAAPAATKAVTVRIPQIQFSGTGALRALTPESRRMVLDSVAPVVSQIVEQSGAKLDAAQMAKLKEVILSKGSIKLPGPGAAAGGYYVELVILGGSPGGRVSTPGD